MCLERGSAANASIRAQGRCRVAANIVLPLKAAKNDNASRNLLVGLEGSVRGEKMRGKEKGREKMKEVHERK